MEKHSESSFEMSNPMAVGMYLGREKLVVCSDFNSCGRTRWQCEFPAIFTVDGRGLLITGIKAEEYLKKYPNAPRNYLMDIISNPSKKNETVVWPTFYLVYVFFHDIYLQLKKLWADRWDGRVVFATPLSLSHTFVLLEKSIEYAGFNVHGIIKSSQASFLSAYFEENLLDTEGIYFVIHLDDGIVDTSIMEIGVDILEVLETNNYNYKNDTNEIKACINQRISEYANHSYRSGVPKYVIIFQNKNIVDYNDIIYDVRKIKKIRIKSGINFSATGAWIQSCKHHAFPLYNMYLLLRSSDYSISIVTQGNNSAISERLDILDSFHVGPNVEEVDLSFAGNLANGIVSEIGDYRYLIELRDDWKKHPENMAIRMELNQDAKLKVQIRNTLSEEKYNYYPFAEIIDYGYKQTDQRINILYAFTYIVFELKDLQVTGQTNPKMNSIVQGLLLIKKQCVDLMVKYGIMKEDMLWEWKQIIEENLGTEIQIITEIIQIVDNFDYALKMIEYIEPCQTWDLFMRLYRQLTTMLEHFGVEKIKTINAKYDPMLHNAVAYSIDSFYEENMIIEEYKKGYIYKGKVLRHSDVKVVN